MGDDPTQETGAAVSNGDSRPISNASGRLPSQVGVRAAFSRPVTAADSLKPTDEVFSEDEEDFLITEVKDEMQIDVSAPKFERFLNREEEIKDQNKTPDIFSAAEWETDLESEEEEEEEDPTFRRLYLKICHKLGVIPTSYFVNHIEDETVTLRHHGLSGKETRALAMALKSILRIEKLDLGSNVMCEKGCRFLCQTLEDNHILKELNISDNLLGNSCVDHIVSMLAHNGTLQKLNISGSGFTDRSAEQLAEALEDCKLKSLDLSRNRFSVSGGAMLGPAISTNVYMDELNLSWNQIRCGGAVAIAKGLRDNVRLSICDLSWNGFGEDGGCAIADALMANTTLKVLDLSANRLTQSVAVRLAKALGHNEVLEVLRLRNNPISTSGSISLVTAIHNAAASELKILDLSGNPVEYEFLRVVKAIKTGKPNFSSPHGTILRAGNSTSDIGKPAIDIERLSKRPIMILQQHIIVNDAAKLRDHLDKIKTNGYGNTYSTEELLNALKALDDKLDDKLVAEAVAKLPRNETNRIELSELLK